MSQKVIILMTAMILIPARGLSAASVWEETMSADPLLSSHWITHTSFSHNYTIASDLMTWPVSSDWSGIDTTPDSNFAEPTKITMTLKATDANGIGFWINFDRSGDTFAAINIITGTVTGGQSVTIQRGVSGLSETIDGFSTDFINVTVLLDPARDMITYSIANVGGGAKTGYAGYLVQTQTGQPKVGTIVCYPGGSGSIDYFKLEVGYQPQNCFEKYAFSAGPQGDFDNDCRVNFYDFSVLASLWMICYDPLNVNCNY